MLPQPLPLPLLRLMACAIVRALAGPDASAVVLFASPFDGVAPSSSSSAAASAASVWPPVKRFNGPNVTPRTTTSHK